MEALAENEKQVKPVSEQLLDVLDDEAGKLAVGELVKQWKALGKLQKKHADYAAETRGKFRAQKNTDAINAAQHKLRKAFDPLFEALHAGLKGLDKSVRGVRATSMSPQRKRPDRALKKLKEALEALHTEVKNVELFFKHIHWLQERFPNAQYEDVTGLCKLATPDEVAEQDYSLNPGRYVGVVIEEDGKTEEEFVEELLAMNEELNSLNSAASKLSRVIAKNLNTLIGE